MTMRLKLFLSLALLCMLMQSQTKITKNIIVQGHRGCRGLMPENTIPAFLHALKLGVFVLEMDVVITADRQVVVSHEPWLNHEICLNERGQEMDSTVGRNYNIFAHTYSELSQIDCGSKIHPRFPRQLKFKTHKPLLEDVLVACVNYCRENNLQAPRFNIELKSEEELYGIYQPFPKEFVELVMQVIQRHLTPKEYFLQSFDFNILRNIHDSFPEVSLATLTETVPSAQANFDSLGFITPIFSPYFVFVDDVMVHYCKMNNVALIPWTVNTVQDFLKLKHAGVDGIITDYPDVLLNSGLK